MEGQPVSNRVDPGYRHQCLLPGGHQGMGFPHSLLLFHPVCRFQNQGLTIRIFLSGSEMFQAVLRIRIRIDLALPEPGAVKLAKINTF